MSQAIRYDASALQDAMEERVGQYETFKEQLAVLKEKMVAVTALGEAFEGKAAERIKGFFKAQSVVVESWIQFVEQQIAFMRDVSAMADDRELGGKTAIDVPFLDNELQTAHVRLTELVRRQQKDLANVLTSVNDLISLQAYSSEEVEQSLEEAKQKRWDTVEAVEEYDHALVSEYAQSEESQMLIAGLVDAMMNATSQNGEITPMSFNSQAFEASMPYQVKDEVQERSMDYITYKQEQQDVREAQAKQAELDARPWYEKAWDTTTVFVGEISGYYDSKRATTGIDPVTGEELTATQRATAGALAAAGFIPIVGWGGRILKGGKAVYNTTKGVNAATHSLDAYKSTKTLTTLEKSEFGLYGLVSANGMSEYIIGRDLMGNELTDQQRNASLLQSGLLLGGSAFALRGKTYVGQDMKTVLKKIPASPQLVRTQLRNTSGSLKALSERMAALNIHKSVRPEQVVMSNGQRYNVMDVEKSSLTEGLKRSELSTVNKAIIPSKYSTKIDDKVTIIEKAELQSWIAESFTDGVYRTVRTNEELIFYRTFGGKARAEGGFVSTLPAQNRIQAKIDAALVPSWGNSKASEAVIRVPKGQILNIGKVEQQFTESGTILQGGADQILMPLNWPSEWIIETRSVRSR
ncbi:transposase [Jeotgalibacillus sp. S-D1]|uniref:ribonuclease YeeF family protein n=1 Tax=Jeotgalibacillus sp. S-D1 TaxID=2552189 RepID=UPI00105A5F7E|nr:T7SS effector LXG polymorphic toxin [Jeotgalibacillus sp. S-D1]TDL32800.1 transposase [Jeotgalibacillus sp. S-D1]